MDKFIRKLFVSLSPTMLISKHLNTKYDYAFAVGKAASLMMQTARELNPLKDYLVISPYTLSIDEKNLKSTHPIPDDLSLVAGERLADFVASLPRDAKCLALISGGASSSVVKLNSETNFKVYVKELSDLIYSNNSIETINKFRAAKSVIKNGGLFKLMKCSLDAYILSDVFSNDIATIGGGLTLGANNIIIGDHYLVRDKLAQCLPSHTSFDFKSFEVEQMACEIVDKITKYHDSYSTSEAQVNVTELGVGGRNQHLVLLVLHKLKKQNYSEKFFFLSCSTDGIDGNSANAGAWIDLELLKASELSEIEDKLDKFNSSLFFKHNAINTGPTFNNLLDFQIIGMI
jgi:glycerate 2-kinase